MRPLLPAFLVGLFALWSGTFEGGATALGAGVGMLGLLLCGLYGVDEWSDAWRLGPVGRLLPFAAMAGVLASWWASPVRRAGLVVVVLLPALYLLPAAVARCLRSDSDRRRGGLALALVLAAVSVWALVGRFAGGTERAALPIGHHLPTAAWLVLLLPVVVLGVRRPGTGRWVAGGAAILGSAALALTRSLLGGLALAFELALAGAVLGRKRGALTVLWPGALVVAGASLLLRLARLEDGRDASLSARLTYWRGGFEGFAERPLLGWGPGSTPWTAGQHLEARPGINPPAEMVTDLHSLPLQALYELGAVTPVLLAAALVLLLLRVRASSKDDLSKDRAWQMAWVVGLAGFAFVALGAASFGAAALPVAWVVLVGALIATISPPPLRRESPLGQTLPRVVAGAYLFAAVAVLTPLLIAQASYERALRASDQADLQYLEIGRAVAQDPGFPLYRSIFGLLGGDADEMLSAAAAVPGVAGVWLEAGLVGAELGNSSALAALDQACRLAPLAALPTFWSLDLLPQSARSDDFDAVARAARVLAADPRLAASPMWRRHPGLREEAVQRLQREDRIDAGWRLELARQMAVIAGLPAGGKVEISLGLDQESGFTFSELVFRRRPWPADWASVELEEELLRRIDLPPAARLVSTGASVFSAASCSPESETSGPAARI